ncbi:MAG: T9SS type A sorting domain-containing protein, partial [Flavobacteriales bacterium]|nr:T9SS type A sorting domain-containing protein [Flavobacteriales bacterium]
NRVVAGAQDNGTEMLTGSTWDAIMGGDGMECAIDHYDEDIIYAEYQYGGLRKSYNGGNSWNNIKPVNYEGGWNTPYEMHQTNNNLIVAGYDEVYRSTTAGAIWDSVSFNVSNGAAIRSIALASSDEDYIYAATYSKIKVTKDAGQSWTYIKPGLPNYNITDVAVSTTNPDRVWVTLSDYNNAHKVYESIDAGDNWTNVSGSNLPALPVNCIVYQGGANDDLYIGTDVGVYYKDNTMSDWAPFNDGLPNVIVKELEIHYDEGTISAATYGRGVWKSDLNTLSTVNSNYFNHVKFTIYPNPADDKITIHTTENKVLISIYSITGQKIISTKSKSINTASLAKGYYVVEVKSESGTKREKLVIK